VNPKLRSLLARVSLVGGIALVASLVAKSAPHDQTIAVRLSDVQVTHVSGVVTRQGESEATVGFSQDFPGGSPSLVRHRFSAPDGTYIVVIALRLAPAIEADGAKPPIPSETSFERQVSLVGGEVIVSPD
jgi:hypothetical protein